MNLSFLNGLISLDIETVSGYPNFNSFLLDNPNLANRWILLHEKECNKTNSRFINMKPYESYEKMAGLYPEFSKIANVSIAKFNLNSENYLNSEIETISLNGNEPNIIKSTFNICQKSSKIIGHNIKGFDIPFLSRRAIKNSIQIPSCINTIGKKPWELDNIIDTQQLWNFNGSIGINTGLDLLTTFFDIPSPKDTFERETISNSYWNLKDYEGIAKYCELDTKTTLLCYIKIIVPNIENLDFKWKRQDTKTL